MPEYKPRRVGYESSVAITLLKQEGVWPVEAHGQARLARIWWLNLLEEAVVRVNRCDWSQVRDVQGHCETLMRTLARSHVEQARRDQFVLALCDLSNLDKVLDNPGDGLVWSQLTEPLSRYRLRQEFNLLGESEEHKAERERCMQLLRLGSVAEIYLTAAAENVALRWGQETVEAWENTDPQAISSKDES
jgi:hypothetical protein